MVAPVTIIIEDHEANERLDKILASRALGFSRTQLQRWIEHKRVSVDGVTASSRVRPKSGAVVVIDPEPPKASTLVAEDIPLDIIYEDADIAVVNKPAGLVVHPAAGHAKGTLVNALLHRGSVESPSDADALRPGIVHRLDKDTSGLLVIAKTDAAREGLMPQFKAHTISRHYLAICLGKPPQRATYETLYGRHPVHRKKFSSRVNVGKRAVTHIEVIERLFASALVQCRLETGRTHQIRVHLSEHGYPILGDQTYGRPSKDPTIALAQTTIGRQALHATELGFRHPATSKPMKFTVPIPPDFSSALSVLRSR